MVRISNAIGVESVEMGEMPGWAEMVDAVDVGDVVELAGGVDSVEAVEMVIVGVVVCGGMDAWIRGERDRAGRDEGMDLGGKLCQEGWCHDTEMYCCGWRIGVVSRCSA